MRHILLAVTIASLTLTAGAARAETIGYINLRRAYAESEPGKKGIGEIYAARAAAAPAIEKATADLSKAEKSKAKPRVIAKAKAARDELVQRLDQDLAAKDRAASEMISRVVAQVAAERKLDTVHDGAPIYAKHDLTAEVIKRLNAGAAPVAQADEVARLRAELAAEREKNEALRSKTAPPPPAPAPSKPAATAQR